MKVSELKELLDYIIEKVRRETIKEIVEFAEGLVYDEEGFVKTLKDCLKELQDESNIVQG